MIVRVFWSRMTGSTICLVSLGALLALGGGLGAQEAEEKPPSAEELLDRAARAAWGDAPEALTSYRRTISLTLVARKISTTIVVEAMAPDRIRTTITTSGLPDQVRGFDGRVAWAQVPPGAPVVLEGVERGRLVRQARFRAALDWRALWSEAEALGRGPIDGTELDRVRLTGRDGGSVVQGFDPATDRLVYEETRLDDDPDGEVIRIWYEDHEPAGTEGALSAILIPWTIRISGSSGRMIGRVETFEPNVELALSRFSMPTE
jgi:hypothetical protein